MKIALVRLKTYTALLAMIAAIVATWPLFSVVASTFAFTTGGALIYWLVKTAPYWTTGRFDDGTFETKGCPLQMVLTLFFLFAISVVRAAVPAVAEGLDVGYITMLFIGAWGAAIVRNFEKIKKARNEWR
jgi:hypothetical protein